MAKKGGNEIATLIKVIDKGVKDKRDITIDDIIANPVSCGYLLDFCQKSVRCLIVVSIASLHSLARSPGPPSRLTHPVMCASVILHVVLC